MAYRYGKKRVLRKRRAVRKRAPARRRLQSKLNYGDVRHIAAGAALAMGAKAVYSKFKGRRSIPMVQQQPRRKGLNDVPDPGTGGYSQWTQRYQTGKFGKLTPRKIDKLSIDKIIFTHQRIGAFNDYGQMFLQNQVEADGVLRYPLALMELNSTNNNVNGVIGTANPVYTMYQPAATTNIAWLLQQGQTSDGTTFSPSWQLERAPHLATQTMAYPGDSAIHLWSSIDLECWGCRNKPTKYDIMLCQFSEDVLPNWSTITDQNGVEFWQSMIKHYTYSPLAKISSGFNAKKMKILKHYTFNLDPTANYENDPDPHVKTMKLFYRFNRKCNFQWKFNNPLGQTIANMNQADWQQEDAENQTQVHPNARLYVMVRASNFTRNEFPAVGDNTNTPSMSWRLRTAYMINQ